MIRVIAIGKKHEQWIEAGLKRYLERLRQPWNIEWQLLPHSSLEGLRAREEESERILLKLRPEDYVIVLDEHGTSLNSPAITQTIESQTTRGRQVVCIIGGAYGVNNPVLQRADLIWSLSTLVFPHQLVRLILVEQIYRSQQISRGHPYHHE